MMFVKALLIGAFAAIAAAQSTSLQITNVTSPVTAGQPAIINYITSDSSSPVTIILRQGTDETDTDIISTLTTEATGGSYTWTPNSGLADGSDYSLEIEQGDQTNYWGGVELVGGSTASSTVASSATASSTASSASATITSDAGNSSTTAPTSSSTGTSGNTTVNSATITSTGSSASHTGAASSNGASFQSTSTGASPSATTTNAASGLTQGSSTVALIFGAIAAILYC